MSRIVLAAPAPAPLPEEAPVKKDNSQRRGIIASIIIASLVVHLAGLALFGLWIVARQFAKVEAVFQVRETLKIPLQKTPEHRMSVAAHEAAAPKPVFQDKLVSTRPAPFSLPELPKLDVQQMLPLDPSELVSDQVTSLVGTAGLGSGLGAGLSGSGGAGKALANFTFMGIKAEGRRIVLLFDVSGSVVNKANATGMPLGKIKEETLKLISGLPSGAQFGLVQFVRNYKPFRAEMTPVTPANRDLAAQWMESEWNESGQMPRGGAGVRSPEPNGVVCVLDAAFELKPDVIFLISDGGFWQTYPQERRIPHEDLEDKMNEMQKGRAERIPVHFIGFQMHPNDKGAWERIVRRTGGKLREIK